MPSHRIRVLFVVLSCISYAACKSQAAPAPDASSEPVERAEPIEPGDAKTAEKGSEEITEPDDEDEPMTRGASQLRLGRVETEEGETFVAGKWSIVETDGNLLVAPRKGEEKTRTLFDMDEEKRACAEDAEGTAASGEYGGEVHVLFVTEMMIGYKLDVGGDCGGARMMWEHDFFTVNLETMKRASLLDIASEEDIMRALDRSPVIQEARRGEGCAEAPESADISGFAITRIDHGDVEVAIAMPAAYGACGSSIEVATISVPAKSIEVRKAIMAAQDAGLLARKLAPKQLQSTQND